MAPPRRRVAPGGADPGLFGPASVTWRVMAEPVLGLGASRALLLQTTHPLVAQGALDHSRFAPDPVGRLTRTVAWVTTVAFGTTAQARAACRGLNRRHRAVEGLLPPGHGTRRVRAGTPYAARDAALILWVPAALVETLIVCHDALVGGLTAGDRDRMVCEWNVVARLLGAGAAPAFASWPGLQAWIARDIVDGPVLPGRAAREVAATILGGPPPGDVPLVRRALRPLTRLVVQGLLPEPVRDAYGIRWRRRDAGAHAAALAAIRRSHPWLPPPPRRSPAHQAALARLEGGGSRRARAALRRIVDPQRS